jgi:hypothetical protein
VSIIDQIEELGLGKVQSARSKGSLYGLLQSSPAVLVSGDLARFPDQPKIHDPNDDPSSRMGDEGSPNESQSVDDATGYSREEEEAKTIDCEEV